MEWGTDWRPEAGDGGLLAPHTEGDEMIFQGAAGPGPAWRGGAGRGRAIRLPVGGITGHFR